MREVPAHLDAQGKRLDEKALLALADAPEPRAGGNNRGNFGGANRAAFDFINAKLRFFQEENAALLIDPSRGDGGTIFVQSASVPAPPRDPNAPAPQFGGGTPVYDKS